MLALPEHFRRRHARSDALKLLDGDPIEAVLATRFLDGSLDHAADEGGNLLHAVARCGIPGDRGLRFHAVVDRRSSGWA